MKYLFFDLSETNTGYSILETTNNKIKIIDFGAKSFTGFDCMGEELTEMNKFFIDLLVRIKPDVIGIEDIFSQSIKGYKKLAKIQGICEKACYNYNKAIPIIALASKIRKTFGLVIGNRILSEIQYNKKKKKIPYKVYLEKTLENPTNYRNKFKHIDFTESQYLYYRNNLLYDIRKQEDRNRLTKTYKNGNQALLGKPLDEYDYAKKIVVVLYINKELKTEFTYAENDICDSLLGGLFLIRTVEI